jgi:S1-C subfamily serine protease
MDKRFYVRMRGRVLGPYDWQKLLSLARCGQLSRTHELSTDAKNWVEATTYPELFGSDTGFDAVLAPPATRPTDTAVAAGPTRPRLPSKPLAGLRLDRSHLVVLVSVAGIAATALALSVILLMYNHQNAAPNTGSARPPQNRDSSAVASTTADTERKPVPAKPTDGSPPSSSIATSDSERYIASVKDLDDIRQAVGLVVVGMEITSGVRRFESALSSGSAFAIGSKTGVMLTNRHVVDHYCWLSTNASWKQILRRKGLVAREKLWVFLSGQKITASLLYASPQFDFALLKIPRTVVKTFRLKIDSSKLMDEEVRAIGFPGNAGTALSHEQRIAQLSKIRILDVSDRKEEEEGIPVVSDVKTLFCSQELQFVVTRGAICQIPYDEAKRTGWIQHTANIGPGSSGGPLLLPNGVVIGINTKLSGRTSEERGAEYFRAISVGQLRPEIDRFLSDDVWIP